MAAGFSSESEESESETTAFLAGTAAAFFDGAAAFLAAGFSSESESSELDSAFLTAFLAAAFLVADAPEALEALEAAL